MVKGGQTNHHLLCLSPRTNCLITEIPLWSFVSMWDSLSGDRIHSLHLQFSSHSHCHLSVAHPHSVTYCSRRGVTSHHPRLSNWFDFKMATALINYSTHGNSVHNTSNGFHNNHSTSTTISSNSVTSSSNNPYRVGGKILSKKSLNICMLSICIRHSIYLAGPYIPNINKLSAYSSY